MKEGGRTFESSAFISDHGVLLTIFGSTTFNGPPLRPSPNVHNLNVITSSLDSHPEYCEYSTLQPLAGIHNGGFYKPFNNCHHGLGNNVTHGSAKNFSAHTTPLFRKLCLPVDSVANKLAM